MDLNELAERAVLVRLFQTYPDSFVWIGGSVLHLLYRSSRSSFDLDLTPAGKPPPIADVEATIEAAMAECNSMGGQPLSETRTALLSSVLGPATVVVPLDTSLLAQKLRTLLLRAHVKPGDLYDIWFLHERGVRLNEHQRAVLADSLAMAEVDLETASLRVSHFSQRSWVAALERSGVRLTPDAAKQIVDTVRELVSGVFR